MVKNIVRHLIIALTIFDFCVFAMAASEINQFAFSPGTAGMNWSVPYMTSEIQVQSATSGNWLDLTTWNSIANQPQNWANLQSIYPGSVFKLGNMWSSGDNIAVRCHAGDTTCIAQITYLTQNKNQ